MQCAQGCLHPPKEVSGGSAPPTHADLPLGRRGPLLVIVLSQEPLLDWEEGCRVAC